MKKLFIPLVLVSFMGCSSVPKEATQGVSINAAACDAFVALMDSGVTTRAQEQSLIRASRISWHALNYAVNDVPLPADISTTSVTQANKPVDASVINNIRAQKDNKKVTAELQEALPR